MKYKALILSAVLMLSMIGAAGCGDNGKKNETASSQVSEQSKTEVSDQTSEESKTAPEGSEEKSGEPSEQSEAQGTPVPASWFDDAVFIGDSVTLKLSYYAENGDLGEANFLCEGSLGYHNCLDDIDKEGNVHPTYMGEKCTIFDGVSLIKPKKVFVMLGMNDIGLYGVDDTITVMQEVMEKLKESCPDAVYYVQPVTPMIAGYSLGDLNNVNIRDFDEKLKAVCDEKGYNFIDVYSAVSDENGDLPLEYCGDIPSDDNPNGMGLHFTAEGCKVWADYLKSHVS